jgi:peptidyl-prolyl cis-trans isomerase B (cyclophilin B)
VFVFPPLGIYFGYKAKQQIANTGERGVELANAGVIVGWIFTSFYILWCLGVGVFVFGGLIASTRH